MVSQYEMFMVAYVKNSKIHLINGGVNSAYKGCGVGKFFGNKGGIQLHFNLGGKHFNFIGCHLVHGQFNRLKRDDMMEEIIRCMKIERQELDPDILADYNFILGDLNYRMESTYEQMIDTDKIKIANELIDTLD